MKSSSQLALALLQAMTADMQAYILPDSKVTDREFANQMIGHLDGPQQREAQAALEAVQVEPVAWNDWPEYHKQAMGCGLEDRRITDRYEAMQYGWDQAIEHVAERGPFYATPQQPAPGWALVPIAWKFNFNNGVVCTVYSAKEANDIRKNLDANESETELYAAGAS